MLLIPRALETFILIFETLAGINEASRSREMALLEAQFTGLVVRVDRVERENAALRSQVQELERQAAQHAALRDQVQGLGRQVAAREYQLNVLSSQNTRAFHYLMHLYLRRDELAAVRTGLAQLRGHASRIEMLEWYQEHMDPDGYFAARRARDELNRRQAADHDDEHVNQGHADARDHSFGESGDEVRDSDADEERSSGGQSADSDGERSVNNVDSTGTAASDDEASGVDAEGTGETEASFHYTENDDDGSIDWDDLGSVDYAANEVGGELATSENDVGDDE